MPQNPPNPPMTITDRGVKSITDLAENQARQGFEDFGNAAGDLPGFVAGPTPSSPAALPLYGITRAACRTWARGGGPQNLPGFDSAWSGICGDYLGEIGEKPDDGSLTLPFEGGQCDAVSYTVTAQFDEYFSDCTKVGRTFGPNTYLGPIGGIVAVPGEVSCAAEGATARGWQLQTGNGLIGITNVSPQGNSTPTNITVTRNDNLDDNCGNPLPLYRPPTRAPNLQPIGPQPVGFPGIGPIDVDVSFGPDGEIIISLPDIDGEFSIGNPFAPEAPGGGGGGTPTNPGSPGGGGSTGGGGESSGQAPDGSELVGVLVEVVGTPENPNRFDNISTTVYRGIGYVAMGYPGLLGIDTSASVVESPQFFHAQQRGLTAWRVRANVGFNLETTPYYREIES